MGVITLDDSKDGKSAAEEAQTTSEAAAAEKAAAAKEDKTKNNGSENAEGKESETESEGEQTIELKSKHVSVNEDGLFVFRVDPEDPKSTFYTGKDMDELLEKVTEGIKEKDATLRKRKVSDRLRDADEHAERASKQDGESTTRDLIPPPDRNEIVRNAFKNADIPLTMVSMTDDQWVKFAEEKGFPEWKIVELRASIKETYAKAMDVYDDKNVQFVNSQMFQDDIAGIAEVLEASDVDPDEFDLEAVVDEVRKNPANFKEGGVVRSGAFLKAAWLQIRKLEKPKSESKVRAKLNEEIARGEEEKSKAAKNTKGAEGTKFEKSSASPKNSEQAYEQGLKMFEEYVRKQKKS